MRDARCGAETCLVQPQRESGEDRVRVGAAVAREGLVHMFEAALQCDAVARQERELGRAVRKTFQSREAIHRRYLADRPETSSGEFVLPMTTEVLRALRR